MVKFMYLLRDVSCGAITVAYETETRKLGMAFQNPKDNFSKKTGRETAINNMKYEIPGHNTLKSRDVMVFVCYLMTFFRSSFPGRYKKVNSSLS